MSTDSSFYTSRRLRISSSRRALGQHSVPSFTIAVVALWKTWFVPKLGSSQNLVLQTTGQEHSFFRNVLPDSGSIPRRGMTSPHSVVIPTVYSDD